MTQCSVLPAGILCTIIRAASHACQGLMMTKADIVGGQSDTDQCSPNDNLLLSHVSFDVIQCKRIFADDSIDRWAITYMAQMNPLICESSSALSNGWIVLQAVQAMQLIVLSSSCFPYIAHSSGHFTPFPCAYVHPPKSYLAVQSQLHVDRI